MGISPKEAFDAVKVLWPATQKITKTGTGWTAHNHHTLPLTTSQSGAQVDWGSTTEYPMPEPKWRDARPEDLAYPFKEARFRDRDVDTWLYSELRGISGDLEKLAWPWLAGGGNFYGQCQVLDD